MESSPRDAALAWADKVLNDNADKEAIVVTHSFVTTDSTRVDECDAPGNYDVAGNRGEDMWYKYVQQHPNVILVVNGHTWYTGRRADLGLGGNVVNQVLSDYQALANGGNGYLRILTFKPSLNRIDVETYSPFLNAYMTDSANQFSLLYHAAGPLGTTGTIKGRLRIKKIGSQDDCKAIPAVSISTGSKSVLGTTGGNYTLSSLSPGSVHGHRIEKQLPGTN